ncbi:MAG: hypothetical protein H6701_13925 [Myxococcales bacterium]|nr:hypothetical protein [Myxococcales bacterium]
MADFDDIVATFRGHVARDPAAPAIAWFDAQAQVTHGQRPLPGYLARCEGLTSGASERAQRRRQGERVL